VSALPAGDFSCYVVAERLGKIVGFGYWCRSEEDGRLWAALFVEPAMRERGLGRRIYRLLAAAQRSEPLFAAIREDNAASVRAAEAAGYFEVEPSLFLTVGGGWRVFSSRRIPV
jgi:GNAT superfamily N-acetyltransferase